MRLGVGEFLQEKATSFTVGRGVPEQLLVEGFLGLLDREIDKAVEDQLAAYKSKPDERGLHQFESILLRYEDPRQGRNFLEGLKRRKGLGSLLQQFSKWLSSEEDSPANHCLEDAVGILRELHYGETPSGARRNSFPPMEEESWQSLAAALKEQLHSVVLRELLLRAVRRALL